MSEEKINSEAIFEIKLCEDFRYFECTDDVIISFNVSSGEVNILDLLQQKLQCRKRDWNLKYAFEE